MNPEGFSGWSDDNQSEAITSERDERKGFRKRRPSVLPRFAGVPKREALQYSGGKNKEEQVRRILAGAGVTVEHGVPDTAARIPQPREPEAERDFNERPELADADAVLKTAGGKAAVSELASEAPPADHDNGLSERAEQFQTSWEEVEVPLEPGREAVILAPAGGGRSYGYGTPESGEAADELVPDEEPAHQTQSPAQHLTESYEAPVLDAGNNTGEPAGEQEPSAGGPFETAPSAPWAAWAQKTPMVPVGPNRQSPNGGGTGRGGSGGRGGNGNGNGNGGGGPTAFHAIPFPGSRRTAVPSVGRSVETGAYANKAERTRALVTGLFFGYVLGRHRGRKKAERGHKKELGQWNKQREQMQTDLQFSRAEQTRQQSELTEQRAAGEKYRAENERLRAATANGAGRAAAEQRGSGFSVKERQPGGRLPEVQRLATDAEVDERPVVEEGNRLVSSEWLVTKVNKETGIPVEGQVRGEAFRGEVRAEKGQLGSKRTAKAVGAALAAAAVASADHGGGFAPGGSDSAASSAQAPGATAQSSSQSSSRDNGSDPPVSRTGGPVWPYAIALVVIVALLFIML